MARPANPLLSANILSRATLHWAGGLFRHGASLSEEHLWDVLPSESTAAVTSRIEASWREELRVYGASGSSLWRAFARIFALPYAGVSVWLAIKGAFVFAQAEILGALLDHLADPTSRPLDGYLLALGLSLSSTAAGLLHHTFFFGGWRAGQQWRTAGQALLFAKALRLRLDALAGVSVGRLVSLASADLERTAKLAQMGTYLFLAPIECGIVTWLLWREVGAAALAGMGALVLIILWQSRFGHYFARFRARTAAITDERLRITSQVVSGVRVLKAFGWEAPYRATVEAVRAREVKQVRASSALRAVNEGLFTVAPALVGVVTFMVAYALGQVLTARNVFVSFSLLSFLQVEVSKFWAVGIEAVAEMDVAFTRIREVLLLPEATLLEDDCGGASSSSGGCGDVNYQQPPVPASGPLDLTAGSSADVPPSPAGAVDEVAAGSKLSGLAEDATAGVTLTDLTCDWHSEEGIAARHEATVTTAGAAPSSHEHLPRAHTLTRVSLRVRPGELCAVVGAVGSGKSSLLMALLGELRPTPSSSGSASVSPVRVVGRVAYTSQQPWVMTGSVRDNITLGGRAPATPGDATSADDASQGGSTLCVGSDSPSAIDWPRYHRVCEACCLGPDFDAWADGDLSIVGERGVTLSGGQKARVALARACYVGGDVFLLDDPLSAVDARVGRLLFERVIRGLLRDAAVVLVTHHLHVLPAADNVLVLAAGSVAMQGPFARLASEHQVGGAQGGGAGDALTALLTSHDGDKEVEEGLAWGRASSGGGDEGAGKVRSNGDGNVESVEGGSSAIDGSDANGDSNSTATPPRKEGKPDAVDVPSLMPTPSGDAPKLGASSRSIVQAEAVGVVRDVFTRYALAGARPWALIALALLLVGGGILITMSSVALAAWSGQSSTQQYSSSAAALYGGLVAAAVVVAQVRAFAFFYVACEASRVLHDAAFERVLAAPCSFYDANPRFVAVV